MPSAISQQVLGLATSTSPGLAQAGGYNILPAGIVFPFAGGTAPTGFLLCQGQQISKTAYAALYAAIGDDYATQIDPTTGVAWPAPDADKFRVPDYRGIFLRGVGTPSGLDAVTRGAQQVDKTKKTAGLTATNSTSSLSALGLNSSSVSGSVGGSDGTHAHRTGTLVGGSSTNFHTWTAASTASGVTYGFGYGDHAVSATNSGHGHGISLTSAAQSLASSTVAAQTITLNGDNETRPINKGVAYIIKA